MTKSEIFARAHKMTRKTRETYPSADYRATFAAALKIAYQEETLTAAEIWNGYTDSEKMNALTALTFFEYGRRDARTTVKNGQRINLPNVFTWVHDTAADLEQVANDAYIYLYNYLDSREEWTLSTMLSRAVIQAAQYISRNERRNPTALKLDKKTGAEYIDASAEPIAEPIAPSPEAAAIIADSIERAAADELDALIIDGLKLGYSAREIAEPLRMSHTAVNKRIRRIRERYAAQE